MGALPQAIKILAIQGDVVSHVLALCYAVPFVVLEFVQWLGDEPGHGGEGGNANAFKIVEVVFVVLGSVLHLSLSANLMALLPLRYFLGHAVHLELGQFALLSVSTLAILAASLQILRPGSGSWSTLFARRLLLAFCLITLLMRCEVEDFTHALVVGLLLFIAATFAQSIRIRIC